ncbi:MAG: xanthine dehydrogenase family protein molybdopterin-binding subunit [Myxococcota bacterium]
MNSPDRVSRRGFMVGAGGLTLAVALPMRGKGFAATRADPPFEANAFVRIAPDNTVTVMIKHIEFGQGPSTGLATLVAEELDADWSQMRAEPAPANVELYANSAMGLQGTGGSSATPSSYLPMREAGAAARAMLVEAAAKQWGVSKKAITVKKGVVSHARSGRSARFGELVARAAKLKPPTKITLKDPKDFTLIGTEVPKLDTPGKTDGSSVFTLDVYRDDMLTAVVEHAPMFGATVKSFDDTKALAVPGVVAVAQVPQGVAVYGENTYAALKGREALTVQWDGSKAETRSTSEMRQEYETASRKPGAIAAEKGQVEQALADAKTVVESKIVFPYLAHAPMEPLDAVIEQRGSWAQAWLGAQLTTVDHQVIAQVLGLEQSAVDVYVMLSGGSFGRRAQAASDFAREAADVFVASGRSRPVKLMWTREDDVRGGFYRPMVVHRMRAGLDGDGELVAWDQTIVAQSVVRGSPFEGLIQNGIDPTMVEGAQELYYETPNLRVSAHEMRSGVPVLWWRSVGHTHTAFAVETMVDELLERASKDPVEGRLKWLGKKHVREAAVLKRAAELAGWGKKPPEGRAFGVAVHKSFGTYVAYIAEVSMGRKQPRVHRVWAAVDCGQPINVNVIKAQIEGGLGYGLSAALHNAIELDRGRVVQSNFHDFKSMRIREMPEVEVDVLASREAPTGIGEPGVPPIAPAVANAVRRLTGKRVEQLPFAKELV